MGLTEPALNSVRALSENTNAMALIHGIRPCAEKSSFYGGEDPTCQVVLVGASLEVNGSLLAHSQKSHVDVQLHQLSCTCLRLAIPQYFESLGYAQSALLLCIEYVPDIVSSPIGIVTFWYALHHMHQEPSHQLWDVKGDLLRRPWGMGTFLMMKLLYPPHSPLSPVITTRRTFLTGRTATNGESTSSILNLWLIPKSTCSSDAQIEALVKTALRNGIRCSKVYQRCQFSYGPLQEVAMFYVLMACLEYTLAWISSPWRGSLRMVAHWWLHLALSWLLQQPQASWPLWFFGYFSHYQCDHVCPWERPQPASTNCECSMWGSWARQPMNA